MSDVLVERLREGAQWLPRPTHDTCAALMTDAANRIEQLEAERGEALAFLVMERGRGVRHRDTLQASLKKSRRLLDEALAERDQFRKDWHAARREVLRLQHVEVERDTLAEIVQLLNVSVEPYAEGETVWWLITDDWFDYTLTPERAERFQQVLDRITKETSDDE